MSTTPLHQKLSTAHGALLTVHKALLEHERTRYEHVHGQIPSPQKFLDLLLNDPFFSWLRKLSGLIVQLDEHLSSKDPLDPATAKALLDEARTLLTPDEHGSDFAQNYFMAIQDSPHIALTHADWKRTMTALLAP